MAYDGTFEDVLFIDNPVPMCVVDQDGGRILAVNRAAVRAYGYSHDEFLGLTATDLLVEADRPALHAYIAKRDADADADADLRPPRFRHAGKDGSLVDVDVIVSQVFAHAGKRARMITMVDVTDAKRRALALRTSDTMLASTRELTGVGTFVVELDSGDVRLTGDVMRAWGAPSFRGDEVPAVLRRKLPPEEWDLGDAYLESLARAEPFEAEHRLIVDDGVRWFHTRTHVIRDAEGKPRSVAGVMWDITERKRDHERLHALAYVDEASGLPNRAALLERSLADAVCPSLILVRRARLAATSSTSPETRERTRALIARVREIVTEDAFFARYGEDTLAVFIPRSARARAAESLAKRILAALERPLGADDRQFVITPKIGVASAEDGACTLAELARRAESALDQTAASGRSIEVYAADLEDAANRRDTIELHLHHAIAEERVSTVYQPLVCLRTGRIVGAEALMRWTCPGLGVVSPAEFIAIAEESGVIVRLGDWIMREACAQMRRWHLAGFDGLRIAVNVSARQIEMREFVQMIIAACDVTGLDPAFLELEITERTMMENAERCLTNLRTLRRLGVSISIDDFGTGYSSLSYLKDLPLDTLKIDRSFVAPIVEDAYRAEIARSVVALAHGRTLRVIGEGVETEAQAARLRAMGCNEAQGYFFGRPMDAESFGALLERTRGSVPLVASG